MSNELIKVEGGVAFLNEETAFALAELERMLKAIKEQEDDLKAKIQAEMESKNIIKIDTDSVTISYIAETTREAFDSKLFKAENPDIYDAYVKISPVKASVRVKTK